MNGYRGYRLTLAPASSFLTPLQSDTLFGHLCWAMRNQRGEKTLEAFLQRFDNGPPPILLSAAFPAGMVPRPVLSLTDRERREVIQSAYGDGAIETMRRGMAAFKTIEHVPYVDADVLGMWLERLSGQTLARLFFSLALCPRYGLAPTRLGCQATFRTCGIFWEQKCVVQRFSGLEKTTTVMRNTVNRQRWTTTEGAASLYAQDEVYFARDQEVWLWLAEDQDATKVQSWFEWVGEGGFGKRASAGRGRFQVRALEEFDGLPRTQQANAFMTLSAWVPAAGEPVNGWYQLVVKRGKLGSTYATDLPVWKYPLLMVAPGAVFQEREPLPYYGRLVRGVHRHHSQVVQYGYALTLPLRLRDNSGEEEGT